MISGLLCAVVVAFLFVAPGGCKKDDHGHDHPHGEGADHSHDDSESSAHPPTRTEPLPPTRTEPLPPDDFEAQGEAAATGAGEDADAVETGGEAPAKHGHAHGSEGAHDHGHADH